MKVTYQGPKGGDNKVIHAGYCDITTSDLFKAETSIIVDDYSGTGNTYKKRDTPIISITIEGDNLFNGTFADLKNTLQTQPKKTFFLFGEDAIKVYDEGDINAVVEAYENNDIMYSMFAYDSEKTQPIDLLLAFIGWNEFTVITEEEYNLL
ncbi:MAG: hypothetical protein WAT79_08395 [Saprospiraceae bacterium]